MFAYQPATAASHSLMMGLPPGVSALMSCTMGRVMPSGPSEPNASQAPGQTGLPGSNGLKVTTNAAASACSAEKKSLNVNDSMPVPNKPSVDGVSSRLL